MISAFFISNLSYLDSGLYAPCSQQQNKCKCLTIKIFTKSQLWLVGGFANPSLIPRLDWQLSFISWALIGWVAAQASVFSSLSPPIGWPARCTGVQSVFLATSLLLVKTGFLNVEMAPFWAEDWCVHCNSSAIFLTLGKLSRPNFLATLVAKCFKAKLLKTLNLIDKFYKVYF